MQKLVAATVVLTGLGVLLIAGVAVNYGRIPHPVGRDHYDMAHPPGSVRWVTREKEPWRFWPRAAFFGAAGLGAMATGVWMWRERPASPASRPASNHAFDKVANSEP